MKTLQFLACLLVVLLTSCSSSITPTAFQVEVTRIVQITTTPIPTETLTPAPTLDEGAISGTAIAEEIGTPIVASDECYRTAQSQRDLNDCAASRLEDLKMHMAELFKALEVRYQRVSPEQLEKFRNLHAEWENFSDRECRFRSGLDGEGWPGTMAPMNYGGCMEGKYEARLREYQIQIWQWTH
jgi:uncharacterized protein YecT (DUF1311 family)